MSPSSSGVVESKACARVSTEDIHGYIPPCRPGAHPRKLTKNNKYQVNIPMIPQGMVCTTRIVPVLMHRKYYDHDMSRLKDIMVDPYVLMVVVVQDLRLCIS